MEVERCPHCGASLKKYWHSITPGLVSVLTKCYDYVKEHDLNRFKMNELKLSHSEYGNFQKLRFHGLIAKCKFLGEVQEREWLLTKRGAEFLCGKIEVPKQVQTFRNKVVDHSLETVHVSRVWEGQIPWFQSKFDYSLFEPKQASLID